MKKPDKGAAQAGKAVVKAEKALVTVDKHKVAGAGPQDLMQMMMEQRDDTAKLMSELVNKLFEDGESTLLKISRVSQDLSYFLIKHLICISFFGEFWEGIRVEKRIVKTDKYPFWKSIVSYETELQEGISHRYKALTKQILSLTISLNGQGRVEVIEMAKTLIMRVQEDKLEKPSLLNRVGLG